MSSISNSGQLDENIDNTLGFMFYKDKLLVILDNNKAYIPSLRDLELSDISIVNKQYLGMLDDSPCYFGEILETGTIGEGVEFLGLRDLFNLLDYDIVFLAGKALQIINWNKNNKYCGRCGYITDNKSGDSSRVCSNCGLVNYPRISPAIIVAITKGDKILLAKNNQHKSNFYSVLAGFVEPGETLEECVKREVMEEVGIEIKNIKYFGSQPWPFPDSLMIAFTAEYHRGKIKADGEELSIANWFSKDDLPEIPGPISISRRLIDWFIDNN